MATKYVGINGINYTLIEPAIGKGGEGSVYKIEAVPDCVAKIYVDKERTETKHRKILTMINKPLSKHAMDQIAWPIDALYENGLFVGFIMPIVSNTEKLNVIYSGKYNCTLFESITIAKNLCAAVNSIHEAGQICGDLNPNNICIDPNTARVTLVDTDSYHITDNDGRRTYRCNVGLGEYLAKELQDKLHNNTDKNLKTLPLPTFTIETDLFALAVHIFALLMNGCHPFACATNGSNQSVSPLSQTQNSVALPQPIDNIRDGFFPFYTRKSGITTPTYAPEFGTLPTNIQTLFIKAFVDGNSNPKLRPTAEQWYNELSQFQQNLQTCTKQPTHMYSSHLTYCPWCALEQNMVTIQKSLSKPIPVVQSSSAQNNGNNSNTTNKNIKNKVNNAKNKAKSTAAWPKTEAEKRHFIINSIFSAIVTGGVSFLISLLLETEIGPLIAITIASAIIGVFGTNIYNLYWSSFAKKGKFEGKDVFLSILTAIGAVVAIAVVIVLVVAIGAIILAVLGIILGIALVVDILGG